MSVLVRPIDRLDLPLVLDIEQRSHSHPWTLRNFEDAFAAGYLGLAAWEGSQMRGFTLLMRALDEVELLDVAVAPEFRRQGVARTLLRSAITQVRGIGCAAMHLEVRASNDGARALYRAEGFEEIGLRVGYYPAGRSREDAILMKKIW